jgi:hypothetical protein
MTLVESSAITVAYAPSPATMTARNGPRAGDGGMMKLVSEEFCLKHELKDVRFTGIELSRISTRKPGRPRWLELELYRITEGPNTGHYVLSTIAYSDVYHGGPRGCDKGISMTFGEALEQTTSARPCADCVPPRPSQIGPGFPVRMEEDVHETVGYETIADLLDAMSVKQDTFKLKAGEMSGPSKSLLHDAAGKDPKIYAALTGTVEM